MLVALYGASLVGAASAQVKGKVYRIGWLVGSVPTPGETYRKFVDRVTQLGHVDGQRLLIDYGSFETHDEGKALAAELVRLKVDLIVAQAPPALLAALVIHAKTAREFGVPIPRSLLVRADRIEEQ